MATKTYKPKRKISATESEEIKIPASSVDGLSTVATSGSYNDLTNKPTIPSAPTNYVTTDTAQDITGAKDFYGTQRFASGIKLGDGNTLIGAGDVSNIENIMPQKDGTLAVLGDIPTKVSELTNDSGFTANKGTVTQVKINGTTKSPNSAGLVDLGTISGVSILTNTTIDLSTLNNGMYLWKPNGSNLTLTKVNGSKTYSFSSGFFRDYIKLNVYTSTYKNFIVEYISDEQAPNDTGVQRTTIVNIGNSVTTHTEYISTKPSYEVANESGITPILDYGELEILITTDGALQETSAATTMDISGVDSIRFLRVSKAADKYPCRVKISKQKNMWLSIEVVDNAGGVQRYCEAVDSGIINDTVEITVSMDTTVLESTSACWYYWLNGSAHKTETLS